MGKERIAFIGTGVMGASIVKHLLQNGHEVTVYTRTKEKAEPLIALGASWASSPAEAFKEKDIALTMVGYPADVEEVYFGENGLFQTAKAGNIVIDMTTSEPTLAKKIYAHAQTLGIEALDAPVSGGDVGAQNGTLSIMVGGDQMTFNRAVPVLQQFGANIVYQGEAGAGQHAKMCNQIVIASGMIGVCESLAYGLKAGLDLSTVLQSISSGAAGSWSLSNLAPRMIKEDYAPGFYIKHFVKDMKIALDESKKMGISLPGLALAYEMYEKLIEAGYGENGTQALLTYYK
ncbi:NAD(P)-dependent oxidoreductase [Lysinibacillus sphaericus]|uniref:NAD-binding protein 6-phosphogluconate dehydrogenase n=2 Tax=Lysinibacillus TaxID=400634 RepID=A0A2S0K4H0_LYSSH|nr:MULTISPECIES: NAD(P)-dependent oxidoreductase [Lysinibacillus]AVK98236.1 oxidoreductase [Lysinibacillus sphaericus]MED4543743.1 NAD(P)-dependent oxidoreductase [Lysinibacillus sphaericus]TKI19232.1 NAD(P)-dependent oxidoreductase [Lysinibacillus sphaericus]TKI48623.1 NAD(P)-dependent oxidoreductase [Lysinibacillus tabacifolii]UDK95590.1 NAD(P)-dependent oxidoreductase [Lysinibacillus sphaericus]